MIAMRLVVVSFDEHFALEFFCGLHRDVQIVAGSILTVINHFASDAVQRAVIELKSFPGQAVFEAAEGVVMQIIGDAQCVRCFAIFDLAVGQTGQELIGTGQLSGRFGTENDFTLFLKFKGVIHFEPAIIKLSALQYLHSLKKIQCLIKLVVVLGAEFGRRTL